LNWLDIIIVVVILIFTFFGFRKGFLRKLLGIAGIILGFILAVKFYKPVSGFLSGLIKVNLSISGVLCFFLIIIFVFTLAVWIAKFIAGLNSGTTLTDKILGTVFGFLEGLLLASILVVNMSYLNYPDANVRESSILYSKVYNVAPAIFDKVISLSPELKQIYEEYKKMILA
jgi:membrane protein required for colicin V production